MWREDATHKALFLPWVGVKAQVRGDFAPQGERRLKTLCPGQGNLAPLLLRPHNDTPGYDGVARSGGLEGERETSGPDYRAQRLM